LGCALIYQVLLGARLCVVFFDRYLDVSRLGDCVCSIRVGHDHRQVARALQDRVGPTTGDRTVPLEGGTLVHPDFADDQLLFVDALVLVLVDQVAPPTGWSALRFG